MNVQQSQFNTEVSALPPVQTELISNVSYPILNSQLIFFQLQFMQFSCANTIMFKKMKINQFFSVLPTCPKQISMQLVSSPMYNDFVFKHTILNRLQFLFDIYYLHEKYISAQIMKEKCTYIYVNNKQYTGIKVAMLLIMFVCL